MVLFINENFNNAIFTSMYVCGIIKWISGTNFWSSILSFWREKLHILLQPCVRFNDVHLYPSQMLTTLLYISEAYCLDFFFWNIRCVMILTEFMQKESLNFLLLIRCKFWHKEQKAAMCSFFARRQPVLDGFCISIYEYKLNFWNLLYATSNFALC